LIDPAVRGVVEVEPLGFRVHVRVRLDVEIELHEGRLEDRRFVDGVLAHASRRSLSDKSPTETAFSVATAVVVRDDDPRQRYGRCLPVTKAVTPSRTYPCP